MPSLGHLAHDDHYYALYPLICPTYEILVVQFQMCVCVCVRARARAHTRETERERERLFSLDMFKLCR